MTTVLAPGFGEARCPQTDTSLSEPSSSLLLSVWELRERAKWVEVAAPSSCSFYCELTWRRQVCRQQQYGEGTTEPGAPKGWQWVPCWGVGFSWCPTIPTPDANPAVQGERLSWKQLVATTSSRRYWCLGLPHCLALAINLVQTIIKDNQQVRSCWISPKSNLVHGQAVNGSFHKLSSVHARLLWGLQNVRHSVATRTQKS